MVFFTCNACGQSIKKAQVEKHYLTQCRRCEVLSCMDCGKDFVGDDYKNHTKCISENEKYGGKDYTAKPNKGEVKQSQWIECIQAVTSSKSVSPRVKSFIQRLASFDNIPRKKEKFKRFVKNSLKVWDDGLIEEIWTVFSEAGKKPQAEVKESTGGDSSQELNITASISDNGEASSGQPAEHSRKAGEDDSDNHESEGEGKARENTRYSNGENEGGGDKPVKKKKKKKKEDVDVKIKSDEKIPVRNEVFCSEDGSQKDFETPKHKKKRKHKEKSLGDDMNAVDNICGSSKDGSEDGELRKKRKKKREGAEDTEGHVDVKSEEKKKKHKDVNVHEVLSAAKRPIDELSYSTEDDSLGDDMNAVDNICGSSKDGSEDGELRKKRKKKREGAEDTEGHVDVKSEEKKKKHKDVNVHEVLSAAKRPIDELSYSTEDDSQGESESPRRKKKRKKENKEHQSCDGEASTQGAKELGGENSGVEHGDLPGSLKKNKKCKKRHADVHTSNGVHTGNKEDNTTAAKDKHVHSKKSKSEKRVSKEEFSEDSDHEDNKMHKKKTHKEGAEKMKISDSSDDGLLSVVTKKKRKNKSQKSYYQKDEVSDGLLGVVESKNEAKRQKRRQKAISMYANKIASGKL